jgi:hypothetical protein
MVAMVLLNKERRMNELDTLDRMIKAIRAREWAIRKQEGAIAEYARLEEGRSFVKLLEMRGEIDAQLALLDIDKRNLQSYCGYQMTTVEYYSTAVQSPEITDEQWWEMESANDRLGM